MKRLLLTLLLLLQSPLTLAAIEAHEFSDPAKEEDYKVLINELRCLVCQNQNLADSNADLAKDLRQQTYEMLQQDKSRSEIVDYMVARYGDFVMYRPPLKFSTLLLWLGPFVLLLIALFFVIRKMSRKQKLVAPDQSAMQRAKDLLENQQAQRTNSD